MAQTKAPLATRSTPVPQSLPEAVGTLVDGAPTPEKPPRPTVPEALKARVKRWWKDTDDVPDFDTASKQAIEAQKTLFPARNDPNDANRGNTPREMRRRKDDRRINVALAYKSTMQTVAMTVPEDHGFRWRAKEMVPSMDAMAKPLGKDPYLTAFARTLELLTRDRLDEIGWQDICESWVQDSVSAPLAVLKVTYQRDFSSDPVQELRENDKQDDVARLKELQEQFARAEFNRQDAEFDDMVKLQEALGASTELDVWVGLSVENLSCDSFRFDSNIRSLETVYAARWMSHDILMRRDEVAAKFPFRPTAEGKWTGIHPDDLTSCTAFGENAKALSSDKRGKTKTRGISAQVEAGSGSGKSTKGKDSDLLLVREIWSKRDQRVTVLVGNIEYPALEWVPQRQPEQFYPFVILVMNRVFGSVYGISDVELVQDIQHRMNRKWSDDEKLRFGALPRGVFNNAFDQQEAIKLEDIPPLAMKGINLGGAKSIDEVMKWFASPYSEKWCNVEQDERNFQRMATQPPSFSGAVGESKFASENDSAMQGLQVSASFRQRRVKRVLERFYRVVAEILLQEETPDQVKKTCGPHANWPEIVDQAEAESQAEQILQECEQQVGQQMAPMVVQATSMQDAAGIAAAQRQSDEQIAVLYQQKATEAFGRPEPMSREGMFERLGCKVKVAMNGPQEKQAQAANLLKIFSALGEAAQACLAAGIRFNPRPFLRNVAGWMDADEDLDEMFEGDPNEMVGLLQQSMQQNPNALSPEAAQQLVQMATVVAQAMQQAQMQAQQQQGGQPGAPQGQPPAQGGAPAPAQPQQPAPAAQPAPQPQPQPAGAA